MKLPAFKLLSKEQDRILNLPLDGSYIVMGPPGSGKTVIALYRAQMVHKHGQRSVLLVYNNTLKRYISAATDELKVGTATNNLHRWLKDTYKQYYSTLPPMLTTFNHDWAAILTKVNEKPPPKGSLPYLIVDEGQDFNPMFYQLARYISRNLTVLADGNQVLHKTNSSLDEIRQHAMITYPPEMLRTNYRNTRQIAKLAAMFHSGIETGIPELPTRSGPPVVLKKHHLRPQAIMHIRLYWEQHPDADIGVFLPNNVLVEDYVRRLKQEIGVENVQTYYRKNAGSQSKTIDTLDFTMPAVRVMNYWHAKGLEFDAVFLPELQSFDSDPTSGNTKMLFYVLLSRARENLFLYYLKSETPLISTLREYLVQLDSVPIDDFDARSPISAAKRRKAASNG